ncbi:MAG: PEP-utilizing enzyme [bacterium]|nr:PEP-utilizing enzyme [bacterium]
MWSTTSLMPTYYATAQALLMRGDVYSNGEIFCYFDGHIITAYMRKSQIEKFKQEGKKFLDKSFFQKYGEQYKKETECWWNWVRNIESDNHLQTESTTLLKEYTQFIEYMRDSIAYFGSTRTEFTFATEQLLEEIIKKYYGNKWPDIFGILTTAVVLDDIQKEYLDWLKLLENKYDDQDLLDHTSKYPWLVFGQFHDDRVIEYIKKRISAETGNYGDELERLKNVKQSLKKEQNKILKNSNDDATVARYLATVLQSQSIERMNIKKYWAGSYYLTRKMWLKIAENTGLVLEDLIGFIIPEEVGKIISGNLVDDISLIINDRKRAYAIVISDGVLNVLGSNEATVLFHERIKKAENINNKIKGQTAMLGVARGKVRKVIAGDLDMLQESIRNFKQGEILVTSMTQPNMMVLAQKAAAIIADEGGITSHAAIIARELKVPCIVGCLHAMELLEDGSEVEVNANDGEIIIL